MTRHARLSPPFCHTTVLNPLLNRERDVIDYPKANDFLNVGTSEMQYLELEHARDSKLVKRFFGQVGKPEGSKFRSLNY